MNPFEQLGLETPILKAITDMGFETPSEIQQKAIPTLLGEDTDMVALAQTGTGKTAAFGFPLLQKINTDSKHTQGLILSPTRELCLQIASELKNYAKYLPQINVVAIYGGASIDDQAKQLKKGAQIIVATPGRMQDMIKRNFVDITNISYCILDEADEMLNMGFYEDINAILSYTPQDKSTWLFSATMPNEVAKIARKFMRKPIEITVGTRNQASNTVQHEYYLVNGRHRYLALKRLADANPDIFSVVFCRTKRDTQAVAEKLIEDGYNAAALHGDLSQNQRDLVMKSFRARQIQMLIATDVAARGIDVDDITHVIHYQLPDEIETYNHRSGRTGRAGKSGISMVILPKSEIRKIKEIERVIGQHFEQKQLPTGIEICEIQLYHLANNLKNVEVNPDIEDYLPAIHKELQDLDRETLVKKRYFINIGERDGYDWRTLKDFLKATLNLGKDEVFQVDVKNSFSFFNTESNHTALVMDTFNDFRLDGRFINVEISNKGAGRGRGGKREDEGRSKKKSQPNSRKQKTIEAFDKAFGGKKKKKK